MTQIRVASFILFMLVVASMDAVRVNGQVATDGNCCHEHEEFGRCLTSEEEDGCFAFCKTLDCGFGYCNHEGGVHACFCGCP
ncbi:defensin-like protein 21 [Tripterygium wilfordii]|uniref:defensin-like protein 21 n=1 Tax=Tripterygium wilfordii TaxID=458696 RepID=UPI0018F7F7D0|nr:defensin-like protein 21 [Tripterygium wilfordii]